MAFLTSLDIDRPIFLNGCRIKVRSATKRHVTFEIDPPPKLNLVADFSRPEGLFLTTEEQEE